MRPKAHSIDELFFSLHVLEFRFRRFIRFRQDSMDPRDPMAGGGIEVNPYNNKEQKILGGFETGFKTIMDKLSEINNQIQVLPEQTAKALSGQPPNGVNVKASEGKRQDVRNLTLDYNRLVLIVRR